MSKAKKPKNANKHRALSAQQTIPYIAMHPDGICQIPGGLYTKTLEYEDINYAVASTEDQTAIISGWSACLNYFDSSLPFQLSFVNRRSRNANRYKVNIPAQEDDFNSIRGEYVEMLKGQIAKSNNGIERYKYITFGLPAEGATEARPRLGRVEADVMGNLKRLGVQSRPLDGRDRLAVLHGQMHPGGREPFRFAWKDIPKTGMGTKDYIAPDSFDFRQSRTFRVGQMWGAASYLQIMASELSDKLLAEILELDAELTVTMHIQTVDQLKAIKTIKGKISDIGRMKAEEQKKAVRAGYDMEILPPDLITFSKDAAELLADLQSRNERMFLLTFNLVQPALDNHTMGTVFEEVIRKFNEETNITDAGRHFTPRDIVELITDLAFVPVKGKIQSTTYRIYDGACGTGGMLTVAEGRMQEMAKEFGKNVSIHLYGQENSDETYAIARSDMLVKGEGVQANNIFFGSTISNDGFSGETFDFMLSNPPFGTPWKTDLKAWGDIKKDEITDTRFRVNYKGEDFSLIPDIGDPQMLFLANNISKMKKNTVLGSRIVEVHNSSSLSTGKAGSGPSNLRQYIIEQDMLEAIVALPEEMFYNTPITTYIWVLTNKKDVKRKGKVQLIDATKIKTSLRKNLGNKKFEISKELRSKILDIYMGFDQADSKLSKIVDNSDFGYWEVPIMHPLYDENGKIVVETKGKNKGKPKADKDLTDKNRVQFSYAGGVEAFYSEEVKPYSPDAWIDWDNIKIGYDISFTKYFYDPEDLRDALDIVSDLNNIHSESTQTLEKIIEHAKGNAVLQTTNMKDSGNKWLGKIPAHWDLVYLWQICAEQKNKNSQNQENNVLSLSHGNIIRKKDLNYGLVPKDYVGYQIVEPGNIILRLTDLQNDQKSLRTALVREKGIITSAYVCLKTTQNPRFIQLILHVYDINKYFYGLGGGVRQSIGYQELKNMVIPIPPEEEQKKIVDFVDTKCASVGFEIDRMIEQLKQEIALLGQYKTQMAADIITGRTNLSEIDYALISDVPTDHTEEVAEDAE